MRRQKMLGVTTELPPTRPEREQFGTAYRRWKRRGRVVAVAPFLGGFAGLFGGGVLAFRLGLGAFGFALVAAGVDTYRHREAYRTLFTYLDWSQTWGQSPAVPTDPERLPRLQTTGFVVSGLLVSLIGAFFPVG
jgi:hypothetical protein